MKNYYASKNGECYSFRVKIARDEAVNKRGFKPLTAAEAMKQFGYTDSCSCRVIKCIKVMPREYLFRAKRAFTGEWVEGSLLVDKRNSGTCYLEKYPYIHMVLSETVGQFTGLTDKNGKKIFEGDLLKIRTPNYSTVKKVAYSGAQYVAVAKDGGECDFQYVTDIEVIGNIYDNPDKFIEPTEDED